MEDLILGIIWPSAEVKRTLLLGIHDIYTTHFNMGPTERASLR